MYAVLRRPVLREIGSANGLVVVIERHQCVHVCSSSFTTYNQIETCKNDFCRRPPAAERRRDPKKVTSMVPFTSCFWLDRMCHTFIAERSASSCRVEFPSSGFGVHLAAVHDHDRGDTSQTLAPPERQWWPQNFEGRARKAHYLCCYGLYSTVDAVCAASCSTLQQPADSSNAPGMLTPFLLRTLKLILPDDSYLRSRLPLLPLRSHIPQANRVTAAERDAPRLRWHPGHRVSIDCSGSDLIDIGNALRRCRDWT